MFPPCAGSPGRRLPGRECNTGLVRRMGRIVLASGTTVIVGVLTFAITAYVMLRIAPSTVLSSTNCSFSPPAHSCSTPLNPWKLWALLPYLSGVLGMGAVGSRLIRRRRARSVPIAN
jgi:hypothetical protein